MTGILLTCVVLILITGSCLYLVIARPDTVAAVVYRALRNADPWSRRSRLLSRLLVIKRADPEAFATVPDPVDEHFTTAPHIVAGQDIDDSLLIAELQQAYADYRAGRDIFAGAPREI